MGLVQSLGRADRALGNELAISNRVDPFDMLGARDNQRNFLNPAPIDFPYDYDRDARVNATDMLIARNNTTHFLNALRLITIPVGKVDAEGAKQAGTRLDSQADSETHASDDEPDLPVLEAAHVLEHVGNIVHNRRGARVAVA